MKVVLMGGCGCPADMPGLFDRPMVMGTFGKIFFGRDEKMARFARGSYAHKAGTSNPYKEKAPAMMGDRGRRLGAMGEMSIFILECLKRIGAGLAKTLIIFLRNAARFWETI